MISVFCVDTHNTVVFAAQELRRYLRMMMPKAGEIPVSYAPTAKSGIRVGLMSSFGSEASDVADGELDEILYACVADGNGVISGNNPRAVLLSEHGKKKSFALKLPPSRKYSVCSPDSPKAS